MLLFLLGQTRLFPSKKSYIAYLLSKLRGSSPFLAQFSLSITDLMMKKINLLVALMLFSGAVMAAKPTSVNFDSYGATDTGVEYANYFAKCSNGKAKALTVWDNRRKWCVGEESTENCHKKQLKAAKKACKMK